MKYSGEISAQLRRRPESQVLYEQVQLAERELRDCKEVVDRAGTSSATARVRLGQSRRALLSACAVAVQLCELDGPSQARSVLDADSHDEHAIAANLVPYVRSIQHAGPGVATLLVDRRARALADEAAVDRTRAEFEAAAREYEAALYRAAAMLAQAKALMAALGTPLGDRKPARRAKRAAVETVLVPVPVPAGAAPAVDHDGDAVH